MQKVRDKEIADMIEWLIEQLQKTYGMEREEVIKAFHEWYERNW